MQQLANEAYERELHRELAKLDYYFSLLRERSERWCKG